MESVASPSSTARNNTDPVTFWQFTQDFLKLPARIIAHLRKVDAYIEQNMYQLERNHLQSPNGAIFLRGPWSFFTSGYVLALIGMAILLNRIQNLVVPPRHPFGLRFRHSRRRPLWRILYYSFLPINFSSTFTRFILRVPSLYLLTQSLLLLSVILLQSLHLFPSWPLLDRLGQWADKTEMSDACWSTFGAVCTAISISAFTRGLDGSGTNSSFNLFGYAFILHLYASPGSHNVTDKSEKPSRPDKHALITIILPLLQLTMLHAQGVRKSWRKQRLVPTTICGALSLAHFLYVVLWESPSAFPIINFLPSLLEAFLVSIIALTCSLNAITQILLEGQISRPLFGNGARSLPSWDEEFAVALLRLGTSSLEATSVAGLGNEVAEIPAADESVVELDRSGTITVIPHKKGANPFASEIKNIKAKSPETDGWVDAAWLKELVRFCKGIAAFARGFGRGIRWAWIGPSQIPVAPLSTAQPSAAVQYEDAETYPVAYQRFLRGEAVTDDEGEFEASLTHHSTSDSSSQSEDGDSDEQDDNAATLYADLSPNTETGHSTSITPVLMAHLTASTRVTRRRYSQLLSGSTIQVENQWSNFVRERREILNSESNTNGWQDERRRQCVVCIANERVVICWPCRCLSMCDDCRSNLASRFPASKHTCPCCRQSIEGYSRIFIP